MIVLKKILWAVIALGLTTNLAYSGEENTPPPEENLEGEKCDDILDYIFAYYNLEKNSLATKEWRSQFNFCNHRPTGDAPELLQSIFGLDENSTPEDYKMPVKALKHVARSDSGYNPLYGVKTRPGTPGDPVARYLLWYIYSNGLTGKVKEKDAKRWLFGAVYLGHVQAQKMVDQLEAKTE